MRNYVVLTKKTKIRIIYSVEISYRMFICYLFSYFKCNDQNIKSGHLWTVGNRLFKFSSGMFLCFLNFLQ